MKIVKEMKTVVVKKVVYRRKVAGADFKEEEGMGRAGEEEGGVGECENEMSKSEAWVQRCGGDAVYGLQRGSADPPFRVATHAASK